MMSKIRGLFWGIVSIILFAGMIVFGILAMFWMMVFLMIGAFVVGLISVFNLKDKK